MQQNRWRLGLCPRPHWGADSTPLDLLVGFKGIYFKVPTPKGSGMAGRGRGGAPKCSMPQTPEELAPLLLIRGRAEGPEHWFAGGGTI